MKKKSKRKVTFLFFRILAGITLPLLILLAVFTGLILKREMDSQKRFYIQEGKIALDALDKELEVLLENPSILDSPTLLKERFEAIAKKLHIEKVDLIDPDKQSSLVARSSSTPWASSSENKTRGKSPFPKKSSQSEIASDELLNIQKSLALRREGKNSYLSLNGRAKTLHGYLPVRDKARGRILVATIQFNLISLQKAFSGTLALVLGVAFMTLMVALVIAFLLTVRIVRPIWAINRACREMLAGNLGLQVEVQTGDELEVMAENFNRMSQALLIMTRQAKDSNPLTQLPGNQEITSELLKRLEAGKKFIYFHVDIDHFKAYNDHYGLARGDDVLRHTGEILASAISEGGQDGSFLGHQGGDDYVMMLEPGKAKSIADLVCKKFDASLKNFYDKEDLERGYFVGEDERAVSLTGQVDIKRHPLMSLSLAGVSNVRSSFMSYQDVLERAVPVKKKAKKIPYSKYLIDE